MQRYGSLRESYGDKVIFCLFIHEKRLHGMWTFSGNQLGSFLKNIVKFTSTRT